jgi:hypothetical protein
MPGLILLMIKAVKKVSVSVNLHKEAQKRVVRALKRVGWIEPTDILINEATTYLIAHGTPPSKHSHKIICDKLRNFRPETLPPITPSAGRKYVDLLILAFAMSLEIAVEPRMKVQQVPTSEEQKVILLETLIRKAAKKLVLPRDAYAREVALRYNIVFEGTVFECFGFWERNNTYCVRCLDKAACFELVKAASMGALANPAITEFHTGEDLRESQPLRALQIEKSTNEGTIAAVIDRKLLLVWLGQEFPSLSRIDYTESVNFQITHPYRKRMLLLKIDKFTTRAYNVIFSVISDIQAEDFGLTKIRGNWMHTQPDVLKLQEEIRKYLAIAMEIPAISAVLSKEEQIKQEIQQKLVREWSGVLESRADHDVFIDSRRQKILRFSRLPTKGFRLDFSRWSREKAAEYGLKYTSSGARYEGSDRQELEKLLHIYLHSIKSSYFGPRNIALSSEFS